MKILFVVLAAFILTTGCTETIDYVKSIVTVEEEAEKLAPNLCPADKPQALVVKGVCTGDWSYSYDSTSKIYTCTHTQKATVYCPPGAVVIGQPSACGGQVDQYTKTAITSNATCGDLFGGNAHVAYRLVCCI